MKGKIFAPLQERILSPSLKNLQNSLISTRYEQPIYPTTDAGQVHCLLLSGKRPVLDCVRYSSGERSGLPVLYDSIQQAQKDQFFNDDWDEVVPASEYFERVNSQIK